MSGWKLAVFLPCLIYTQLSQSSQEAEKKTEESGKEGNKPKNRGKLILDATCAPSDISYPTDLELLNQARKQTEKIIDSVSCLFSAFLCLVLKTTPFFGSNIIKTYIFTDCTQQKLMFVPCLNN